MTRVAITPQMMLANAADLRELDRHLPAYASTLVLEAADMLEEVALELMVRHSPAPSDPKEEQK